ncbi:MAG TPA: hypothetical protein VHS32_40975, partial [Streptosporangiaceae bacterium]|nr:hypothetical protein [Streptosporangiaceae bacterium]
DLHLTFIDPIRPAGLRQRPSLTFVPLAMDQPLVPLARRRTGVKMAGGTACDVVSSLVAGRPRFSLALGAGS